MLFIHETHCCSEMAIEIDGFSSIQHPCMYSTQEHPRGGCIMFIKKHLMKFVKGFDLNFNDSIIVYMFQNLIICGIYIPPDNSKYFDDQFDTLDIFTDKAESTKDTIVCGDLNSRTGSIVKLNGYCYDENVDVNINQNGRRLLELCKSNEMVPLNMLKYEKTRVSQEVLLFRKEIACRKMIGFWHRKVLLVMLKSSVWLIHYQRFLIIRQCKQL